MEGNGEEESTECPSVQCPSCKERGGLTGPADALPGPKAAAPKVVVALPSLPKPLLGVTLCSFRMFDSVSMVEKVNHHTSEGREGSSNLLTNRWKPKSIPLEGLCPQNMTDSSGVCYSTTSDLTQLTKGVSKAHCNVCTGTVQCLGH